MSFHQHQFDRVEDYLHHRPPYLMIDRIVSMDANEIVTEKQLSGDEYFFPGHFPGAPIVPGAMMQEMTTQSAGILIAGHYNPMKQYNTSDPNFNEFALGVLVKVSRARFRGFARPGQLLTVAVRLNARVGDMFEFSGAVNIAEKMIMRNTFHLTNLKSKALVGE